MMLYEQMNLHQEVTAIHFSHGGTEGRMLWMQSFLYFPFCRVGSTREGLLNAEEVGEDSSNFLLVQAPNLLLCPFAVHGVVSPCD